MTTTQLQEIDMNIYYLSTQHRNDYDIFPVLVVVAKDEKAACLLAKRCTDRAAWPRKAKNVTVTLLGTAIDDEASYVLLSDLMPQKLRMPWGD